VIGVATEITSALEAVRRRREGLGEILGQLGALVTSSSERSLPWAEVHSGLSRLRSSFSEHLEVTEGPNGLHEEVLQRAPRLSGTVARLQREHRALERVIDDTVNLVPPESQDPRALARAREAVEELLAALERHRRLGATLVYEAYSVDLGSGD
jgi:hypothetical protein